MSGTSATNGVNLNGGSKNDILNGGSGNDHISGGAGNDVINGGAGSDNLDGGSGDDTIAGGDGNDDINGASGNDIIDGGTGDDDISGDSGDDVIDGGAGSDNVDAGSGNDTMIYVVGQNGLQSHDDYEGGSGIDTLRLVMTRDEWMNPFFQFDLLRVKLFLAGNSHNGGWNDCDSDGKGDFQFIAFGLHVSDFEKLEIVVDGKVMDLSDQAVTLKADSIIASEDSASIAFDVLANDSVPDLVKSITFSQAAHGLVTWAAGQPALTDPAAAAQAKLIYTPDPNYYQYLAKGQTATDTFTYKVTDADGDVSTATVTVTITGANDAPVLAADTTPLHALTEMAAVTGGAGVDTSSATLGFTDVDLTNTHVVTTALASSAWSGGAALPANLTAALGGALSMTKVDSTGTGTGSVKAAFSLADKLIDFLAAGETLTLTYAVTVTDNDGGSATRPITFVITGTNDAPVITSPAAAATGAVAEAGNLDNGTAFAGTPSATGTLTSTDVDHNATATWSGTAAGTYGAFAIDATTGKWTYTLNNGMGGAADQLAEGESRTETFLTTVTDDKGATATQLVTITIAGSNDSPVITSTAGAALGAVTEAGNLDNGAAVAGAPSATGMLASSDVDHGATATWSGNAAGTYGAFAIDAVTGKWTYTLTNGTGGAADQLAEGESRTETFLATVTDDKGAIATQTVTVTIAGTNDSPVITSSAPAAAGSVTEAGNLDDGAIVAGTPSATGTLASSDVDHNATAAWTGSAAGTYGAFAIDAVTGKWTYTLGNAKGGAADQLAEGESRTETFLATVTDDKGAIATQIVTINVTGTNDSPVITSSAAAAAGAVTEAGNLDNGAIVAGTPCATGALASADVDHGATATWTGNAAGAYGAFAIDAATGKWTYTLDNSTSGAADRLAEGESRTETFLATVTDDKGAIATQTVTVTITGSNDSPVITSTVAAALGAVTEAGNLDGGQIVAGTPCATGQLASSDVDHGATAAWSGNAAGAYGAFAIDAATGKWTYTLANGTGGAADQLAEGESRTETFLATVTDDKGAIATQLVTVTIAGTNDSPVVISTAAAASGAVTEAGNLDGGAIVAGTPCATGQLASSDVDNGATATWSGSAAGTFGAFAIDAATGKWTYSLNNSAADQLAEGEVRTETFLATVTDDKGATATQLVTINVTGTNDSPIVTSSGEAASGAVIEAGNLDNGAAVAGTASATGMLTSSDVDHGATASWSGNSAGSYGTFAIDAATGKWTYTLANGTGGAADRLAEGEVRTETFLATVTDDKGAIATQLVTVTVTGTNDSPVVTSSAAAATGAVTEAGNLDDGTNAAGTPTATGQLASSDVDNGATAAWSGNAVGSYGAFAIDAITGKWTYTLNNGTGSAADQLAEGESRVETFLATVTDDKGATATQLVTINVTGTNDSPIVTSSAAAASGAVIEAGNLDNGFALSGTRSATGKLTSSDVDHGATASWSGNAAGTYGAFTINAATGNWLYILANAKGGAADQLAEGETRTETFLATVTDDKGATATQLVTISVTGTNDSPVITSAAAAALGAVTEAGNLDDGTIAAGTPTATGQLASSDVDNGATAAWSGNAAGIYGAFEIDAATGKWTYTLNNATGGAADRLAEGVVRTETFLATVTDDKGAIATQMVTVTVTGSNDSPVITSAASAAAGSVVEAGNADDGAILAGTPGATGTLTSSDVDQGATATWSGSAAGTYGAFAIDAASGEWTYTLANGAGGAADRLAEGETRTETFLATVTDDKGATATQLVTILVTGTNDAPVAVADTAAGTENQQLTIDVLANDTDVDTGSVLTLVGASAPASKGLAAVVGNKLVFAPGTDFDHLQLGATETVAVSYTVRDEHGAIATATATIIVTGTNDAPVAGFDSAAATENQSLLIDVLANDSDVDDNAVLTVTAALAPAGKGTASVVGNKLSFVPGTDFDHLALGATEQVTIFYTIADEHGAQSAATVTLVITGTNDAPVAAVDLAAGTENQVLTVNVLANDIDVDDGAVLTLVSATAPAGKGSAAIVGNQIVFAPGSDFDRLALGATETVVVNYLIRDEQGAQSASTLTLTITGSNDAPVVTSNAAAAAGAVSEAGHLDNGTIVPGTASVTHTLTASDVDTGAVLTWTGDANGTYGAFAISAAGVWTYTLDNSRAATESLREGQSVTETFLATVTDEYGAAATQLVTVTIAGTNDKPVITSDAAAASGSVTEAGNADDGTTVAGTPSATGTLASTDVDNGATATWSSTGTGTYGNFAISAAGVWSYTLDNSRAATQALKEGQTATETFTATVTDDKGATASQQVIVTVAGTNDAPIAVADVGAGPSTILTLDNYAGTTGALGTATLDGYQLSGSHFHIYTSGSGFLSNGTPRFILSDAGQPITLTKSGGGAFDLSSFDLGEYSVGSPAATVTLQGTKADGSIVTATFTTDGLADGVGGLNDYQTFAPAGFTNLVSVVFGTNGSTYSLENIALGGGGIHTGENSAVTVDALANDTDPDAGAILSIVAASVAGGQGNVSILANKLVFDPGTSFDYLSAGQTAAVTVNYTIQDEFGATSSSTASIIVDGVEDPVSIAAGGTIAAGAVTEIADGAPGENTSNRTAIGTIQYNDVDTADVHSVTFAAQGTGYLGTLSLGTVNQSANSLGWTFSVADSALDSLAEGQTRTQSYLVTVNDGHGSTATQMVTITLTGTNDAPVVSGVVTGSVAEDSSLSLAALARTADVDTASLTVGLGTLPAGVTYNSTTKLFTLNAADPAYQSLALGQSTVVTVNYTVSDGIAAPVAASASWTVTGRNDAPVVSAAVTGTAVEDGAPVTLNALAYASDVDSGNVLSVIHMSGLPAGVSYNSAAQSFTLDPTNAAYQNLAAGEARVVSVTYDVSDGTATAPTSVSWTVTGTNDAPVIASPLPDLASPEDTVWTYTIPVGSFSDVDNNASLTYSAALAGGGALPSWLSFNAATKTFSGTPPLNFNGTIALQVTASDGSASATDGFNLVVTPVNDAPVASANMESGSFVGGTANYAVKSGFAAFPTSSMTVDFFAQIDASNADSNTLVSYATTTGNDNTFVVLAQQGNLIVYLNGFATIFGAPEMFDHQWHHVAVTYNGATGHSDLFVDGVLTGSSNHTPAPLAAGGTFMLGQEQDSIGGSLDPNQSQIGGIANVNIWSKVLNATEVAGAASGIVALNDPNLVAAYHYNPTSHAYDDASGHGQGMTTVGDLAVRAGPDIHRSAIEQVSLDLKSSGLAVSDVDAGTTPVTVSLSVTEGVLTVSAGTSGAAVSNSGTPNVTVTGTVAQINALLTTDASSVVSYIDHSDTPSASATLTVSVNDNGGTGAGGPLSTVDTAIIAITAVNDAPVVAAAIAAQSTPEDTAWSFTVPAGTFTDVDSASLSYSAALAGGGALPSWLSFNAATHSFSGTPPLNFNGTIALQVTASDGSASVTDSFNLAVTPVDDAPVLSLSKAQTSYVENGPGLIVDSSLSLTDPDGPNLNGAVVSITGNFVAGQDVLSFTSLYGITGAFNAATGQLTLSGTATAAQYQEVLRSVAYANSSDNPATADRTITYAVTPNGAASQYFAANGHFYEYVQTGLIPWASAKAGAEAHSLFGMQGYLATVTSAGENAFVISKLAGNAWLGGSDAAVEGQWKWVTGPEAGQIFYNGIYPSGTTAPGAFSFWQNGEPNNAGDEDYLQYFLNGWNDLPNGGVPGYIDGYLVEYGGMPGDPALSLSQSVTVHVAAVNDLPTLNAALSDAATHPGSAFTYSVPAGAFTDPDSTLAYTATLSGGAALPSWLSFNPATQVFSGTPGVGDLATLQVVVTVSDGIGSASDTFTLGVTPTFTGSAAADSFTGGNTAELILGGGGGDTLSGGGGNDTIYGGAYGELGPSPTLPSNLTATAQSYYTHDHNLVNGLGGTQGFGEGVLAKNDDSYTTPLLNISPIFGAAGVNFFGTQYTTISVNNNGDLTFGQNYGAYTPTPIAATGLPPIIAGFWTDIDTRGTVNTLSPGGNSTGSNLVYYDFDTVNKVFTATWDDVGEFSTGSVPNAFQIQLVDRGSGDFDIIYRYEVINWDHGAARVGFSSGAGVAYELDISGQPAMLNIENIVGNTGLAGVYVFQVRNGQVSTSDNDTIDGGAGADTLIGGSGNDVFVFHPGEANGDHVLDFNGFGTATGDSLRFVGYGTGATFTQLDSTHWQVNYNGGASHDVIAFDNAPPIDPTDWTFV